jgi:hypothetical protein
MASTRVILLTLLAALPLWTADCASFVVTQSAGFSGVTHHTAAPT